MQIIAGIFAGLNTRVRRSMVGRWISIEHPPRTRRLNSNDDDYPIDLRDRGGLPRISIVPPPLLLHEIAETRHVGEGIAGVRIVGR